jgi:DNA ligase-1
MKEFAALFSKLDQTNKTKDKLEYLKNYFLGSSDSDKLWTLALFCQRRPKRTVTASQLRQWCQEEGKIPTWLFDECYHTVGDLAETISLLLPASATVSDLSLTQWISWLKGLSNESEESKKNAVKNAWRQLGREERFVFNKLITGGFRVGVSQNLVTQALAAAFNMEKSEVAHRIMGNWEPDRITFEELILANNLKDDLSRPYPFCLANPIESTITRLGDIGQWQCEWKWDGIRGQLIHRKGEVFLWSRGEEIVTEKFPELLEVGFSLPDGTALDGEILPFDDSGVMPFGKLQTRIGRKNVTKKILRETPVIFMAYDLLESQGRDQRLVPLRNRRELLETLVEKTGHPALLISELVQASSWEELSGLRESSRIKKAEGFMLKHRDSTYETGRKRGHWWKWKIDPLTIDGVLLYAQKGHGRRADLYSDYTLAVWDGELLVPFAKAYSGLTDSEMVKVDRFVKQHTKERFGPVRTVTPELVFEIAFEGIQESPRHKSGIALRFPRILRWRIDKQPKDANTLDDLRQLLETYGK